MDEQLWRGGKGIASVSSSRTDITWEPEPYREVASRQVKAQCGVRFPAASNFNRA